MRGWRLLLRGRDPAVAQAERGSWLPLFVLIALVITALVGSFIWPVLIDELGEFDWPPR